jgi:hypothetical protein
MNLLRETRLEVRRTIAQAIRLKGLQVSPSRFARLVAEANKRPDIVGKAMWRVIQRVAIAAH